MEEISNGNEYIRGGGLGHEKYDYNVPTVIGFRGSKPVYKIIKKFQDKNLNTKTVYYYKVPEIEDKQLVSFNARMISYYGCIQLPYITSSINTLIEYLHSMNKNGAGFSYRNNGENWDDWYLEIEIIYIDNQQ